MSKKYSFALNRMTKILDAYTTLEIDKAINIKEESTYTEGMIDGLAISIKILEQEINYIETSKPQGRD